MSVYLLGGFEDHTGVAPGAENSSDPGQNPGVVLPLSAPGDTLPAGNRGVWISHYLKRGGASPLLCQKRQCVGSSEYERT